MDVLKLKNMLVDFKANGIRNSGKAGLEKVIDFQDIIGRASYEEIRAAWKTLDVAEKPLFIWACSCCLSYETIGSIVMETLGKDYKAQVRKEFDEEYESINKREEELTRRTANVTARENQVESLRVAFSQVSTIINGVTERQS